MLQIVLKLAIFSPQHSSGNIIMDHRIGIITISQFAEMQYKSYFEAFFVKFFGYCSSTAAFSKIFSVVEVFASLQKLMKLRTTDNWGTSSGASFLYSRNLSISAKHQILRYIWSSKKLCISGKTAIQNIDSYF